MTRLHPLAPIGLIAALGLFGCVTAQPEGAAGLPSTAPSKTAASSHGPSVTAAGRPVRPVALSDTSALRALDPAGVEALIGAPNFVRHDGGATIWQYQAHGCVMDLFWYRSDTGLALLYVEARDPNAPRLAETKVCLDDLWSARVDQADS